MNVIVACPSPAVAVTAVGVPGTSSGVTAFEGADAGPVPIEFVAVTVNVYAWPFVSPVTMIGLAAPPALWPPGEAVTVYEVIGAPPVLAGGANETDA